MSATPGTRIHEPILANAPAFMLREGQRIAVHGVDGRGSKLMAMREAG